MNYEEFKTKAIELFETHTDWFAYGDCRKFIPEIDLTEDEIRLRDQPDNLGRLPDDYDKKWWTNFCQERAFKKWMKQLNPEFKEAIKRRETKRKAAWDAKTPEEKAAILEEQRQFQEKCKKAADEALAQYYEEAARTGRYTGD